MKLSVSFSLLLSSYHILTRMSQEAQVEFEIYRNVNFVQYH
jgi:hypothetical protein